MMFYDDIDEAFDEALLYTVIYGDEENQLTKKQARKLEKRRKKEEAKAKKELKKVQAKEKAQAKSETGNKGDIVGGGCGCLVVIVIAVLILGGCWGWF